MLKNCQALVFAGSGYWIKTMHRLLKQAGFFQIQTYAEPDDIDAYRVPHFVFLHDEMNRAEIEAAIRGIRQDGHPGVKFSPIIMVTRDASQKAILKYMAMGFDDIVLYPCAPTIMARRLRLQVEVPQHYFETEKYFGPDRRRGLPRDEITMSKNTEALHYKHIVIQRLMTGSTKILSSTEEMLSSPNQAADMALL